MARKPFAKLEDFLGAIALIVAFFALGVFDFKKEDPLVEAGLQAASDRVVQEAKHAVSVEVDGRDLLLTGLVDSEAEKTRLLKALRNIKRRGSVDAEVEILEVAAPFRTELSLAPDGTITTSGHVPSEAAKARLEQVLDHDLETIRLASGAPQNWIETAELMAKALMHLEQGRVTLDAAQVSFEGTALTPLESGRVERILAAVPEGVSVETRLDLLDDGSPLRLSAHRRIDGAVSVVGKLPEGMVLPGYDASQIITTPVPPPVADWGRAVSDGIQALETLRIGQLSVTGSTLTLSGEAWSDAAMREVKTLMDGMPEGIVPNLVVTQMDNGQPFDLTVKFDGQRAVASGKIPRDLSLRTQGAFLDHPVVEGDVEVARVSASPEWWAAASSGLEGLAHFENGKLRVQDGQMHLSGEAFGPDEKALILAALEGFPQDVDLALDLTLKDDGTPARLNLRFDEGLGAAKGKLPEELRLDDLAKALETEVTDSGLSVAYLPVDKEFTVAAMAGARGLSLAETGTLSVATGKVRLRALVRDPEVGESVEAAMTDIPAGFKVEVDLTYLDDGRPFYLVIQYDGETALSSGKV
ncbi:MAG TPA: BON domain-containing protein, partial [Roseovarius sp.]|nr:BON domain-containing protein [Roseovarius sp.]